MSAEEKATMQEGMPWNLDFNKLVYADDTIVITSTVEAAELILHKIQEESAKYNLRLNQNKCVLLRMNSVRTVHYMNGEQIPIKDKAVYLGSVVTGNGNQHAEVQARISAATVTWKRLQTFWRKAPVTVKWKIRVYDSVILSKLVYGLNSLSLTDTDNNKLDAFHMKGLRKILSIPHAYISRVTNEQVLASANRRARLNKGKEITIASQRLDRSQLTLFGHILRAERDDPMRSVAVDDRGERLKANFRRVGRPRVKWYDVVRKIAENDLIKQEILAADWRNHMRQDEMTELVVAAAIERLF